MTKPRTRRLELIAEDVAALNKFLMLGTSQGLLTVLGLENRERVEAIHAKLKDEKAPAKQTA